MKELKEFWKKSQKDLIFTQSTALAYTTLVTLVPLLAMAFFIFGVFGGFDKLLIRIQPLIEDNLAPSFGDQIRGLLESIIYNVNSRTIGVLAVFGFLFTTLSTLATVEKTFNLIWEVKKNRGWGKRILIYLAFMTLVPIFSATSIVFGTKAFNWLKADNGEVANALVFLLQFVPYMVSSLFFGAVFFIIPNAKVRMKDAARAGLVTGVTFELAKLVYSYYVKTTVNQDAVYGALIILPLFLLWLYVAWLIILFGAEYCYFLEKSKPNGFFGFFPK